MVMIANLQYGWTLFVNPIDQKYHWGRAAIQVAFTIFVLTETWLVPIEGYLIDKFGPQRHGQRQRRAGRDRLGHQLATPTRCSLLYLGAAIGGIGAGVIYGASVGNALKWFPDRRGLAAGLTAAGFGAGSALTVIPIANMIATSGYRVRLPLVRPRAGHRRHAWSRCCCVRRQPGEVAGSGGAGRAADAARLRPGRGAQDAGVLGHVRRCSSWSAPAA